MDKNSNIYIVIYAAVLTVAVAVILSLVSESLNEKQKQNELLDRKTEILKSVGKSDVENVEGFFDERIESRVINAAGEKVDTISALDIELAAQDKKAPESRLYPLFIYTGDDQSKVYIVPVRGSGLWGPIWGNLALKSDFQTLEGVSFGHESETPGLGAEITTTGYQERFPGLSLYRQGEFVGIESVKGEPRFPNNQVRSISGATITADGVAAMIQSDLKNYLDYFNTLQ